MKCVYPVKFEKHKGWTSTIIKYMFLDEADLDYIAARQCYFIGCFNQFLWLSSQSVEKYLKSILLYNNYTAKFGHDNLVFITGFMYNNKPTIPGL